MSEPDYYALIGVGQDATLHEIRSKFRQRVLAEHPDKGGDPKKFQLLNKAYNVLTDQEKRRRYDATGRTEQTAEEEFAAGFGGGRMQEGQRSKDADREAVVNLEERVRAGPSQHDDGFQEWLRGRDTEDMVLTDKDFMKRALFNAVELSTKINHTGPVQHVLGSSKTDQRGQALSGPVQVQAKPKALKRTLDHDELLVRMLAVPVDDSMVYAELQQSGVCLGMSGVGRIEQIGSRIEELKQDDAVFILPKPTKFNSQRPIGTARTLLICNEEDVLRVPPEILEELSPEQICLAPTIVCAYTMLESFGAKLQPGDSVLLNAAHLSASGSAILQLCKLLKLKPICLLSLPGAPKDLVRGEYGMKTAWQDSVSGGEAPPSVKKQYARISEWLLMMGADEVFPDAVALLRWRDRNQRMLPKLALDGIATGDSTEQLIHCLQPGEKDAQVVVYGHGTAKPMAVSPPLLSAWNGALIGFNISRWVHSLSENAQKMMSIMENITKLVRANKFTLDTVLYKVGEDAVTDAFSRAQDAADGSQVVLIFPTLQEELSGSSRSQQQSRPQPFAFAPEERAAQAEPEDLERERLKEEWLSLLFTDRSPAAANDEGAMPVAFESGNRRAPNALVVFIGDSPTDDKVVLQDIADDLSGAAFCYVSWSQHQAGEGLEEFRVTAPEVVDGSFYARDRLSLRNEDLDMLHDMDLLGHAMSETIEAKLAEYKLDWKNVILYGFGKGAGVATYATLLKTFPKQVSSLVLLSPVVPFPMYLAEKISKTQRGSQALKTFVMWGSKNRSTPTAYRELLAQTMKKAPEVMFTPDTIPDGDHTFDYRAYGVLRSLLSIVLPR
jgi:NADPH:quinone reductase-like Zn-dependent oxidoreductase/predicted esterase